MERSSLAIAYSYFKHWLRKEDLYSQQSPFIFAQYQGLLTHLKNPQPTPSTGLEFSSTIFTSARRNGIPITTKANSKAGLDHLWQPRKKGALLCAYFCQTTAAKQVVELGTGTGQVTQLLEQVTKGNLYTFSRLDTSATKHSFSSSTTRISGCTGAKLVAEIQDLNQLDFVVLHPEFSLETLRESLAICLPRMQSEGALALGGIHHSREMNACWQRVQKEDRVRLTFDFFDYGIAFFDYSGPKADLSMGY
jgi:hypothetical protein